MKLRHIVALVAVGGLLAMVVRAATVDLDTLPPQRPDVVVRTPTPFVPTHLEVLQARLARVRRGLDAVGVARQEHRPYDHEAAMLLVRESETLTTLIDAERLMETRK